MSVLSITTQSYVRHLNELSAIHGLHFKIILLLTFPQMQTQMDSLNLHADCETMSL